MNAVREREITFLAASISYYTLVSLVPLLVLALVLASLVGGPAFTARVEELVSGYLLPTGADLVGEALADRTAQGGLGAISLVLTVWGALKVFRGLDTAFSRIYDTPTRGLVSQLTDGTLAMASIGVGFVGVVALGTVIAVLDLPLAEVVAPLVLLGALAVAFLPLYYVFPDVETTVREALPGAGFAAVGWTVLGTLFGVYVQATGGSAAGAMGALLLLVTWFYASGVVLLTGAVVNVVLTDGGAVDDAAADEGAVGRNGTPTDRQVQQAAGRRVGRSDMTGDTDADDQVEPRGAPDISALDERVAELRADLDAFEEDINERTVEKPKLEAELKRYVRARLRRGHARGWGPYLVLLYGVVLALGAFYFLDGGWAILAMVVTFLSTLGLYVVFVAVGVGLDLLGVPGKAVDFARDRHR